MCKIKFLKRRRYKYQISKENDEEKSRLIVIIKVKKTLFSIYKKIKKKAKIFS